MASFEDREEAVRALRRMIVYVRDEAMRLRIADVALLLGYAEDAVVTRPATRSEDFAHDGSPSVPIVHH